jgi:hypothetical protein
MCFHAPSFILRDLQSRHFQLRRLSWCLTLLLASAVAIPIGVANAQFVSSSRDPDVNGYVMDDLPFSFSGNGDSVGSGAFISNINDALRKAVIEYDISDIVPGVLESARVTGRIGPNNGLPLGERANFFSVSAGDGVLNTADNAGGGFSVGFIEHAAGTRSDYDYEITGPFRSVVLDDAGYLKLRISPRSSADQGFDVASMSKLELTLRPTTDDTTVYYEGPAAGGEATATNFGSFSVDQNASTMEVTDRFFSPFEQNRAIIEYDLSSIPASAEVLWAVLDVQLSGFSSQSGVGPTLDIVGYQGDGIATGADAVASAQWVGSTGQIQSTGASSWSVDPEFVETVLQSGDHLGILLRPRDNTGLGATIRLEGSFGDEAGRPRLAIAYKPGTLIGDVDLDGAITFFDIQPFITLLFSGQFQAEADCDGDEIVGFLDIFPFINILGSQ